MSTYSSLDEIRQAINSGEANCVSLVQNYISNIHQRNSELNVFLEIYEDEALAIARTVDQKIANGSAGKLAGMVIGLKDVLCHKNHGLQGGSKILDGFQSQFTATAVQRLIEEDAIVIGRQNCDEFGMGSSSENSAFGPVRNAIDTSRVPGGSSGGSAVAVQADMCLVALGSDTGGSVRQPAAFCGIVGLKPTYSRVSRHGLIAYGSSFDCIGIFSKNIADNALVLEVMAGTDEYDSTVSNEPVPPYTKQLEMTGKKKVAYFKETLEAEGIAPDVKHHTLDKVQQLQNDGHQVDVIDFPLLQYLLPTYYILSTAEASSNLSRYDGVKYGYRSPNTTDLESMYKNSRAEGFGPEVKRRIMLGTFVLSASYYDAYYTKAQKVRRIIREKTKEILRNYDFIVMPTTPTTAFKIGEHSENPLEMYLADLFTVQSSVVGTPAISIPNGEDSKGLPIGFQIIADDFQEANLFAFSNYLMKTPISAVS